MSFSVTILGSSSAIPSHGRHQSAQIIDYNGNLLLVDCGEGTQDLIHKYKFSLNRIDAIFISHLHGDHFLGVFGLLSTMSLLGRTKSIQIFAPVGMDEIITVQLKHSGSILNYPLQFHPLDGISSVYLGNFSGLDVTTIPLHHGIKCQGFLFKEGKKLRNIIPEKVPNTLVRSDLQKLKNGEDIYDQSGNVLAKSEEVTLPPLPSFSYAYISDTRYTPTILPYITDVDVLYHESTFLHELIDRAINTNHTTAFEAGTIAKDAKVKRLLIGHFSSRYKTLEPLLEQAKSVFDNTELALEGHRFMISIF